MADKLKKFESLPVEKKIQFLNYADVLAQSLLISKSNSLENISSGNPSVKQKTLDSWLIKSSPSKRNQLPIQANKNIPQVESSSSSEKMGPISPSTLKISGNDYNSENVLSSKYKAHDDVRSDKQGVEPISILENEISNSVVLIENLSSSTFHEDQGLLHTNKDKECIEANSLSFKPYLKGEKFATGFDSNKRVVIPIKRNLRSHSLKNRDSFEKHLEKERYDFVGGFDSNEKIEIHLKRNLQSNSLKNKSSCGKHLENERCLLKKAIETDKGHSKLCSKDSLSKRKAKKQRKIKCKILYENKEKVIICGAKQFNKMKKELGKHGLKKEESFERREFQEMIKNHGSNPEAASSNKIEPIVTLHKSNKKFMETFIFSSR